MIWEIKHVRIAKLDRRTEHRDAGFPHTVADVRVAAHVQCLQKNASIEGGVFEIDLPLDILEMHVGVDVFVGVGDIEDGAVSDWGHAGDSCGCCERR